MPASRRPSTPRTDRPRTERPARAAEPPPADAPPAVTVVLVEPEIPPNTGNVARLCAATGCRLVLLGRLGFELTDAALKRAGLDYWPYVHWEHHPDAEAYIEALPAGRFHLLSTHATRPYTQMPARAGDWLLFGRETAGLPRALMERYRQQCYTVPISEPGVRSLNLASAVAIVTFDVLRRLRGF